MHVWWCGHIANFFTAVSVVFMLFAIFQPELVAVYLVQDDSQIDEFNPIAEAGLFESFYDSNKVSDFVLRNSGAPEGKFQTQTREYPLLFPAQENFVADVVPIDTDLVDLIDDSTNANGQIKAILQPRVDAVYNKEFESCDEFFETQLRDVDDLLLAFQDFAVPAINLAINQQIITLTQAGLEIARSVLSPVDNPLSEIFLQYLNAAFDSCVGGSLASPLSDICVRGQLAQTATGLNGSDLDLTAGLLFGFLAFVDSACVSFQTFGQCVSLFQLHLEDGPFPGPAQHPDISSIDSDPGFCSLGTEACASNSNYLGFVAGVIGENGNLADALNLGLYLQGVAALQDGFQMITLPNPTSSFIAEAVSDFLPFEAYEFPEIFSEDYAPCAYFALFARTANLTIPGVDKVSLICPFNAYFAASEVVLGQNPANEDLVDTMGRLNRLYVEICNVFLNSTADCPEVLTKVFFDGAYLDDIGVIPLETFEERGIEVCEDDDDLQVAIVRMQRLLIISSFFYCLSIILGLVAIRRGPYAKQVHVSAGIAMWFSGIITFFALAIAARARSDDEAENDQDPRTGDPEVEPFRPTRVTGYVPLLIIIASVAAFISGICHFYAGYFWDREEENEIAAAEEDKAIEAGYKDIKPAKASPQTEDLPIVTAKDI